MKKNWDVYNLPETLALAAEKNFFFANECQHFRSRGSTSTIKSNHSATIPCRHSARVELNYFKLKLPKEIRSRICSNKPDKFFIQCFIGKSSWALIAMGLASLTFRFPVKDKKNRVVANQENLQAQGSCWIWTSVWLTSKKGTVQSWYRMHGKRKSTWHFIFKFKCLNNPLDCAAWVACIDQMIFSMFVWGRTHTRSPPERGSARDSKNGQNLQTKNSVDSQQTFQ